VQKENIIWRIDDRLIHGQVIVGWCGQLPIKRIVVIDDFIAANDWEKELLLLAAPPHILTEILTTMEIPRKIDTWKTAKELTLVLFKSPVTVKILNQEGIHYDKVNIGGIHYREDRKEILSYVYLSDEEIILLGELMQKGITFECQDLPTSTAYDLQKLIKRLK
jgi:mannose/fructose/N-acetylgalactosamine-specific phosphotransferase system component IIB